MVRADGLPKPEIKWYLNGKEIVEDENHKIVTSTDAQVTSTLSVTNYSQSDDGTVNTIFIFNKRKFNLTQHSITH